ncbi:MAG TPA: pilus assembly protein [Candidatus Goldiibacteriota bacterium]|nr:pilus assembly protein [Candidatus Goldiibacteriota bacterium]
MKEKARIIRKSGAQAMAELVIMLPVLLLLFAGLYQFSLISVSKIRLAMVEREVMMFVAEEEGGNAEKWEEFGREIAGKTGLKPERLEINLNMEMPPELPGAVKKFLSSFAGASVELSYEHELMPAFKAISGKSGIKLKTKISGPSGGSFKINPGKKAKELFEKLFGKAGQHESMRD